MDTIECMRTFVSVAKELSFTAGAKRRGISTKVASKYVQQLEAQLKAQLFHRTTRSVTLTETGQAYYDRCIPLLDQFDELEGDVQSRQTELSGVIRLTAPTAFGSSELIDPLSSFQTQHPKVIVELQLSDRNVAIIEDGFDLGIRFGELEDSGMFARRLMNMRIVVAASPKYLKQNGTPEDADALSTHNCLLRQVSIDYGHWEFQVANKLQSFRVNGSFRANSPRALAHMAANDLGICRCPFYVVKPFLQDHRLKLLFEDIETPEIPLHVIYPGSRYLTARVRALIDHLADCYKDIDGK